VFALIMKNNLRMLILLVFLATSCCQEMYYLSISLKSGNIGLKQTSVRITPHAGSAAERQGQHVDFRSCVDPTNICKPMLSCLEIIPRQGIISPRGKVQK
jgi:hypothetical protein